MHLAPARERRVGRLVAVAGGRIRRQPSASTTSGAEIVPRSVSIAIRPSPSAGADRPLTLAVSKVASHSRQSSWQSSR